MDKIKAAQFADLAYYSRFKPPSRLITFAAPASTLTNFPALVKSNSTFHIGTSTGYDVHFQDLAGNELAYDLDYYDPVTGNGAWWVQIPSLSSGETTSIKMLYGDANATTNGSAPTTVWSGFLAVYHFNSTDTSQQFNSATGTYGTWSNDTNHPRATSFVSGGVTGRMLSVNQYFHWGGTTSLTCSCPSAYTNMVNFVAITETNGAFGNSSNTSTGAYFTRWGNMYLTNYGFILYGYNLARTIPYEEGVLEYSNASWRDSDKAAFWQINDQSQTGSGSNGWMLGSAETWCLYCYSSASAGITTTYKIDELRIRRAFPSQDEVAYENNILMHHSTYVTYGPEA